VVEAEANEHAGKGHTIEPIDGAMLEKPTVEDGIDIGGEEGDVEESGIGMREEKGGEGVHGEEEDGVEDQGHHCFLVGGDGGEGAGFHS